VTVADAPATAPPGTGEPSERGTTTIADRVVQKIASIAAGEVDAVTVTRAGWTQVVGGSGLPSASAKVAGGSSRISVEIAAAWPSPLSAVAAKVREHVAHQVTSLTGIDVVAVDVTVADVVHLETARRRVE
jgi:uncharacterized alkaline shock family protein YloU